MLRLIYSFRLKTYVLLLYIFFVAFVNASEVKSVYRISAAQQITALKETVDTIVQAYKNIGIDVHIIKMPAKRALLEASFDETIDAEMVRVESAAEDLPHHIIIPIPLKTLFIYGYTLPEFSHLSDWNSLKAHRVVTLRGFVGIIRSLEKKGLSVSLVDSIDQALALVSTGRIEMAILPDIMAKDELRNEQFRQIQRSKTLIIKEPLFHYIHERHKRLIPEFTKSLEKLLQ